MLRRILLSLIISITASVSYAQYHEIYSNDIRSLQVVCGDRWLAMPVMKLHDYSPTNVMNIAFDDLTHTYRRFTYSMSTARLTGLPPNRSLPVTSSRASPPTTL